MQCHHGKLEYFHLTESSDGWCTNVLCLGMNVVVMESGRTLERICLIIMVN